MFFQYFYFKQSPFRETTLSIYPSYFFHIYNHWILSNFSEIRSKKKDILMNEFVIHIMWIMPKYFPITLNVTRSFIWNIVYVNLIWTLFKLQCPLTWQSKWEGPEDPLQYLRGLVARALAIQVRLNFLVIVLYDGMTTVLQPRILR